MLLKRTLPLLALLLLLLSPAAPLTAQRTVFDFYQQAPNAKWESAVLDGNSNALPGTYQRLSFGTNYREKGSARYEANRRLEDGSYSNVLYTHPQWKPNGAVKGFFPSIAKLPPNSRLVGQIGFGNNPGDTRTNGGRFTVWIHYWVNGREKWETVLDTYKRQTGNLNSVNVDLSKYANKKVYFELRVDAGSSASYDRMVWRNLKVTTRSGAVTNARPKLRGWVDLHAHPMSHLAFGGKVLHGAPDVGVLMPVFSDDCNHKYERPENLSQAMGSCRATHGGHDLFSNGCGDHKRKGLLRITEQTLKASVYHQEEGAVGYPIYNGWPAHNNLTHQQMYVEWIKRNYDHGQRVMVALSVNNVSYSAAFSGPGDRNPDDRSSSDVQIEEMKRMVRRHSWMEVALTSADVRRIINANKMAIILGVEVDNIGNLHKDRSINQHNPSATDRAKVAREVRRLYGQGVRYIFPVHVVDNLFAGTAVYEGAFNVSNYHQTGKYWNVICADSGDGVGFQYEGSNVKEGMMRLLLGVDIFRNPPDPPSCRTGHVNGLGLTRLGEYGIKEMMKLGMMIDMDHMSQKAVNRTLEVASQFNYPVNSGHNGLRGGPEGTERNFTAGQYRKIFRLGGMAGIGTSGTDANQLCAKIRAMQPLAGSGVAFALGTDANGMEALPGPRIGSRIVYNNGFKKSFSGVKFWDYNLEGVAHYGLFSDYLRDVRNLDATLHDQSIMSGAEYFATMWERCERQRGRVR